MTTDLNITILGCGTSTGVPMVGCSCPVCRSADPRDRRTRSSLLIRHDGQTILIDSSTDLRIQALREGIERVDAVLFTHAHADHVNGIDDLRGFFFLQHQLIPCYADRFTVATLHSFFPYIFTKREESVYSPLARTVEVDGPFQLGGLRVVPVPLDHGETPVSGYRIGNFAYLTDCRSIPDSSLPLLEGLELLIIDGLRWKAHPTHFNIDGAVAAAAALKPARTILTHLSHDVSYAQGERLPDGFEFACDGMSFDLPYRS